MQNKDTPIPLAERRRPKTLEAFVGQEALVAQVLQKMLASGKIPSLILWGPPGVGKTTLAHIIAQEIKAPFFTLSAIDSGVKDLRAVIDMAKKAGHAVLFIDEIHRFNKAQQDSLLAAVEKGTITLIGATTENPSFEVISALLSRCQVYVLQPLEISHLQSLVTKAFKEDSQLSSRKQKVAEWDALLRYSSGDARKMLNLVELVSDHLPAGESIGNKDVEQVVQQKMARYDKAGEQHYDIISAFIKSMRGSDPNAAVYWLARMLAGGEDPKFIARRMIILASEDIGNANPNALLLATAAFQSVNVIGMPEGRIVLSQCAIYLACSPKSNASYKAIELATSLVKKTGDAEVPIYLRNAPTALMKQLGYGEDYKYAHDYENNFIEQEMMPEKLAGTKLYEPGENAAEEKLRAFLRQRWRNKYEY